MHHLLEHINQDIKRRQSKDKKSFAVLIHIHNISTYTESEMRFFEEDCVCYREINELDPLPKLRMIVLLSFILRLELGTNFPDCMCW